MLDLLNLNAVDADTFDLAVIGAGSAGFLTGINLLTIALVATLGGIVFLAARNLKRTRRHNQEFEKDDQSERQTS